jgi:pyrroline-5-carboxylate reductase
MTAWPQSLTMLGCGNMGGAMLARWLAAGLPAERLTVVNRSGIAPQPGVRTLISAPPETPDVLVVAVKPYQLDVAAAAIAAMPAPPAVVMSILAGVDLATLKARLPAGATVRALPNLPVAIGQGVTLLHGDAAARGVSAALATPLGLAEWIDDEALFDAATALAGSGPGFLFRYIDALAAAGAAIGLPPEQAARLALATVAGSAAQAATADVPPGELARRVASKGGSTQAGYDVLDRDGALVDLLTRMLAAAERRNAEMGAEARARS